MDRAAGRQDFPKKERLRKRKDFLEIFDQGQRRHSSHFILFYRESGLDQARLGITASRKVGNAVVRNRLKRLIREYYRQHKAGFDPGTDYSLVVKRNFSRLPWVQVVEQLASLLRNRKRTGNKG
ncbi:MAG: ribonuclease P protein component [Deltaproteobacteria bacterium]|nr:ribonuclease P protein component [Deltaproteobacteria bacterium]